MSDLYYRYQTLCLCPRGGTLPPGAEPVAAPFAPPVYLVSRDPMTHRFLSPGADETLPGLLHAPQEPACYTLNTAFPRAFERLARAAKPRSSDLRLTLVGLGDVGGQVLTALKLLGGEIASIGVYDPNTTLCERYVLELGQVLGKARPEIFVQSPERLFDCDLFLFTASRGVPPVGAAGDVRMAQLEKNRDMLRTYARLARQADFAGLFCQISDPVDQLCRCVYLQSNRDEAGEYDFQGLLPEQIMGFGLGVMKARADFMARRAGLHLPSLQVYGPHGADLLVADDPACPDEAVSRDLTAQTVRANLEVRALGFKPYIAPALSSACLSILALLRGEPFYAALPVQGVYFGAEACYTALCPGYVARTLDPGLEAKLADLRSRLWEAEAQCRA